MSDGLIVKSIGGFYYVETPTHVIWECRARGLFRKDGVTPCVGDEVVFEPEYGTVGTVTQIRPRKNQLIRPLLANLDILFLVVSSCDPAPNLLMIDKLIAMCEYKQIHPILLFTKNDLKDTSELETIYRHAGFVCFSVNCRDITGTDVNAIKNHLRGNISAFAGNTGVGKSSLLNVLYPNLDLKTGDTSRKLGRGRHTTRHVELFRLEDIGGYVADTPGFGNVELLRYHQLCQQELQDCFREFAPYQDQCKFTGCSHTVEKGCAVLQALSRTEIEPSRHDSYKAMYQELKNVNPWEH